MLVLYGLLIVPFSAANSPEPPPVSAVQTDPRGYVACSHAIAAVDWLDRLDRIACPTLVIAGAQDVGAPVSMSQAMAERIPGAELAVVADAAHLSVIEQPAVFASLVERFLERIERVA